MRPGWEEVVAEARQWIGTPYHRGGMLKGKAADCGLFPYCVLRKFDLIPEFKVNWLADDWWQHTTEQKYLVMVQRYLKQLVETRTNPDVLAAPGCLILAKVMGSKVYNHAGIVTRWPWVVHAIDPAVQEVSAVRDPYWAQREIVIFDPLARIC